MEFRWIAAITLWTLLAGPMFDAPLKGTKSAARPHVAATSVPPRSR